MKKIFFALGIITVFILSLVSVSAQSLCFPPFSVFGKYNYYGSIAGNIKIEAYNSANTKVGELEDGISSIGEYSMDLSNLPGCYFSVSSVKLTATACSSNADCVKTFSLSGKTKIRQDFIFGTTPITTPEPAPETENETESTSDDVETKVTSSTDNFATVDAFYGQAVEIKVDKNKVSYLVDSQIDINGEDVDVKEEITFNGKILTSIDNKDFGINPYLSINEGDVVYKYIFKDDFVLSEVTEDEPIEINFLGQHIKIIKASATSIKVRSGEELTLKEGESEIVAGKTVKVKTITDSKIEVEVDGISGVVTEGTSKDVNGLNVFVDTILYKNFAGSVSVTQLIVGTESDKTINNGDDFELFVKDEELWTWNIQLSGTEKFIGITNQETYNDIDEDEVYKAVGFGESLFLPNNYLEVKFKSIKDFDRTNLNIKVKDGYLYVKGDEDAFSFGSTDYDKLYVNSAGIYDEDLVLITTDKVEIGDSDIFLERGSIKIGKLEIELDLVDIKYDGVSYKGFDETFMDYLGIIFKDPENAVDEKTGFALSVPEDRPEVSIAFGKDTGVAAIIGTKPSEPIIIEKEVEKIVEFPVEKEVIVEKPVDRVVEVPKEVIKEVEVPINETGKDVVSYLLGGLLTLIASVIGLFKWGKGYSGLLNYWAKKDPERAMKMANTIIENYKKGKYK